MVGGCLVIDDEKWKKEERRIVMSWELERRKKGEGKEEEEGCVGGKGSGNKEVEDMMME